MSAKILEKFEVNRVLLGSCSDGPSTSTGQLQLLEDSFQVTYISFIYIRTPVLTGPRPSGHDDQCDRSATVCNCKCQCGKEQEHENDPQVDFIQCLSLSRRPLLQPAAPANPPRSPPAPPDAPPPPRSVSESANRSARAGLKMQVTVASAPNLTKMGFTPEWITSIPCITYM